MTDSISRGRAGVRARPAVTILSVAVASFLLAVAGTAADGWPLPRAFDEFSQVLAAETFASGRLANPAYRIPEAVETIHVVTQPSHASKYLPGHGLFLALGITLGGGPRLGQWIAFATMGAAVYWLLSGWISRRASLITTGLLVLLLADTDWASGYWGSSVAVAGSALVFGAIRRLEKGPSVSVGLVMGCGVVLLALTRPFEGLAVCAIPAAYVVWWLFSSKEWKRRFWLTAAPCVLVMSLGAALLMAHNTAVTGRATRLAYAHYEDRAPGAPPFIWQPVQAPTGELRANEQARLAIDLGSYTSMRQNWLRGMWSRIADVSVAHYFPHAAFAAVFLLVPVALRDRRLWLIAASVGAAGIAIGVSSYYLPHYLGPAVPPLLILYALACGVLSRDTWLGQRVGRATVGGLSVAIAALGIWQLFSHNPLERAMTNPIYWTRQRARIAQEISALPGKHLAFVRYAPTYKSQNEWVQNNADLANVSLVWVHDRGDLANDTLRVIEAQRTAWLVTIHGGGRVPEFTRYETARYAAGKPLTAKDTTVTRRPARVALGAPLP